MTRDTTREPAEPAEAFRLDCRVVWLYPVLPRFRFKSPQRAGLRLVKPRVPRPFAESSVPELSALDKYRLIQETGECCYWCTRAIGSFHAVNGQSVRLQLHWDHVVPRSHDGVGDITNVVASCHVCNLWKSDRVFATEVEVRTYLEHKWITANQTAPAAEASSLPVVIAEVAPAVSALEVAPTPPIKTRVIQRARARVHLPDIEPARSGQQTNRQLPRSRAHESPVRIISHGATLCPCGTWFCAEIRAKDQQDRCGSMYCTASKRKQHRAVSAAETPTSAPAEAA